MSSDGFSPKLVLAFALGMVVALGIGYFAFSNAPQEKKAMQVASANPAVASEDASKPSPAEAPAAPPAAAPAEPEGSKVSERPAVAESRWQDAPAKAKKPRLPEPAPSRSVAPAAVTRTPVAPPPATGQTAPQVAGSTPSGQLPMPEPPGPAIPMESPAPVAAAPVRETLPPTHEIKHAAPAPRQPASVAIPAGTLVSVRLQEAISSDRNMVGDEFNATLDAPLVVDGFVIAERGAKAEGRIVEAYPAGRVKGLAKVSLELTQFRSSDGQLVRVRTAAFAKEGESTKKSDAAKVGIGAAIGAAIGAIGGGGKGAGTGAAAGGAAGAGVVLATRGKPAELPVETRLSFRIQEAVTLTERLSR